MFAFHKCADSCRASQATAARENGGTLLMGFVRAPGAPDSGRTQPETTYDEVFS